MPDVFGFKENKSKVPVLDTATFNPAGHTGQVAMASQLVPVAITASQTIAPLTNATYIINASNIEVTLATNVQAGLKVSVLALFAGSVKYGNQTDQLTAGAIADYIFNGTEWINLDKKLKNQMFPVGYIHISTVSTSPAELFGGTWEQIKDTFLLACGTTYQAGATGGEANHVLTENEMPTHTHKQNPHKHSVEEAGTSGTGYGFVDSSEARSSGMKYTSYETATNQNTGGGEAHNNMPPYQAVYMWKKTAN